MTTTTTKKPTSKRTPVKPVEPLTKTAGAVDAIAAGTRLVHMLSPWTITPHPANPRKDLGDLTELSDSIRAHGIQQPITVIPHPDKDDEYYALLGHRRLAAAKEVNLVTVPVIIARGLDDAAQLEMMLIENLQRVDLTISEEGAGYQGLLDLGATQTAIAKRTGRAKSTVATRVRIAALPEGARYHVDHHQITIDEALALADLEADAADLYAEATETWAAKGWALKVGHGPEHAHRLSRWFNTFMTPEDHKDCPAGEVWVSSGAYWELANIEHHGYFCCTDAEARHPEELAAWEAAKAAPAAPVVRELSPEERAVQERREAAAGSCKARHEFLADVLTADTDDAQPIIDFVSALAALTASGLESHLGIGEDWYVDRLACDLPRPIARAERAQTLLLISSLDGTLVDSHSDPAAFFPDVDAAFLDLVIRYLDVLSAAGHKLTDHEQQVRAAAVDCRDAVSDEEPDGEDAPEDADA